MKKLTITVFFLVILIFVFNKIILSKIIIYSASKWLEKDLSIKKIDINYFSEVIELNDVKIKKTIVPKKIISVYSLDKATPASVLPINLRRSLEKNMPTNVIKTDKKNA